MAKKPLGAKEQAQRIMNKLDLRGFTKKDQKASGRDGFRSDRTLPAHIGNLKRAAKHIFEKEGINQIKDITPEIAQRFICHQRKRGLSSSTMHNYSRTLSATYYCLHGEKITFKGLKPRSSDAPTTSRAYSREQVVEIINHLDFKCGLVTEFAYATGVRVSEWTSMRPASEFPAQIVEYRQKQLERHKDNRWAGRFPNESLIAYTVSGKGNLNREVKIPQSMAELIEIFRMPETQEVKVNRGEDNRTIIQYYELPTGCSWAKKFSNTSKMLFGNSRKDHGPHGLRHSFAQNRMEELQQLGFSWNEAREIISQEMGHFRSSETDTYLR